VAARKTVFLWIETRGKKIPRKRRRRRRSLTADEEVMVVVV